MFRIYIFDIPLLYRWQKWVILLSDFALIWGSYSAIFTLLIFAHLLPSPDHNFLMLLWGCWVVCPHLYRKGICNLEIIINSNVWNLYIWYTFVISNFIKRLIIISHYPRPVSVFNSGKQSSDLYSPPFLAFFPMFCSSKGKGIKRKETFSCFDNRHKRGSKMHIKPFTK